MRLAVLALVALAACTVDRPTPTPAATPDPLDAGFTTVAVDIGSAQFTAVVVDTPKLLARGLSGRDTLAPDRAMWFDLGVEGPATFWMRGMRFPIDIVWVDAGLRVVHVTHEAGVPEPGLSDADLPRYDAAGLPVRYVLEINAGLADELGIGPGSLVTLTEP